MKILHIGCQCRGQTHPLTTSDALREESFQGCERDGIQVHILSRAFLSENE